MDSLLQITGFPSLETVHGTQLLSVPSESNGPPKTIFGTICCQCGRSHHRKTFEIIPRPPSPPPEPPDLSKTDKVRKKLMIGITRAKTADYTEMSRWQDPEGKFRDLMDEEEFKLTFGSYPLWGRKEQKKQERKLYKVSFNKACGCGNQDHFTCPQCLKFRVVAEGEWATEEQAPDRSALLRNG